jgi:hypothetical protein
MLLKTTWITDDPEELADDRRDLYQNRKKFRRHIQDAVEK